MITSYGACTRPNPESKLTVLANFGHNREKEANASFSPPALHITEPRLVASCVFWRCEGCRGNIIHKRSDIFRHDPWIDVHFAFTSLLTWGFALSTPDSYILIDTRALQELQHPPALHATWSSSK